MVWLLPLVTGEVLRPRLTYDVRRWATVFPLGMYAACSLATGQVTGITGIADFGQVWTWVAFTVSLLALAGCSVTAGRCCLVITIRRQQIRARYLPSRLASARMSLLNVKTQLKNR
jgi:tellurite resistance protein TehA-like permease